MPDNPTRRVIALIGLLIVVAAALRGYLPAAGRALRTEPGGGRAALMFVIAALGGSLAVLAVAVIARLRDPRAMAPSSASLSAMRGTARGRPSWRVVLIGFGVVAAWLLLVILLSRLVTVHGVGTPTPTQDPTAPPSAHTAAPPAQHLHPRSDTGGMLPILLAGTALMLFMLVTGTVIVSRRRWRAAAPGGAAAAEPVESPAPPTRSESLVRAAERGLAEMTDLSREPREAIIACYAAMERELANVPGAVPQDFDTPTEVLARAVEHHALRADNAVRLVNLFAEARFSRHVMNEGHRDLAARVLRLVLDELGSRSAA